MTYPRSQGQDSNTDLVIPQSLYMRQLELGPKDTLPGLTAWDQPLSHW